MPTTIYCDESGFTGNNLLDAQQPHFVYASVAVEDDVARDLVARAVRDFRLDGSELKGQRLLGSNRGRKAITFLVEQTVSRAKVSIWHKRYTLASKFFEHIFEPVLAEQNSVFYTSGFHRFISNIIYFESIASADAAARALVAFQSAMRDPGSELVNAMFPVSAISSEYSPVLQDIETFARCHRVTIAADVEGYDSANSLYRWMLEASVSALWALLTGWGERLDGGAMTVYCDDSKPLYENRAHFDIMIGRKDRSYVRFEDKARPLTFNLSGPLNFVSSHQHAGIQIADVLASCGAYAFKHDREDLSARWRQLLLPAIELPVLPDTEVVDLEKPHGFVNWLVLRELVDRSVRQENLFHGMPEFIQAARASHREFLETIRTQPSRGA